MNFSTKLKEKDTEYIYLFISLCGAIAKLGAQAASFLRFPDHTKR